MTEINKRFRYLMSKTNVTNYAASVWVGHSEVTVSNWRMGKFKMKEKYLGRFETELIKHCLELLMIIMQKRKEKKK